MNAPISDRIPAIYKNLVKYRNNQIWGHLPMTDEILNFFEKVTQYTKVDHILETGFNFGFSCASQLTVHQNATLHSYDISDWNATGSAIYDKTYDRLNTVRSSALAKLVWDERFVFHKKSSGSVLKDYEFGFFDYALLDGDHSYRGLYKDISNCKALGIKYLYIDNLEQVDDLKKVVTNRKDMKEIDMHEYYAIHPKVKSKVYDKIGLFELV